MIENYSRTIDEVIRGLPSPPEKELPAPPYVLPNEDAWVRTKVGLMCPSMADHMSNEGYEIFRGLEKSGYQLWGRSAPNDSTDVITILVVANPSVVVLQDKREWDRESPGFRKKDEHFDNVSLLSGRDDVFKLTILKDSHARPKYHRESADEIGCHAWVIYYHPRIVKHLAPYVRTDHLIRTYHTIDPAWVPTYSPDHRDGCLLSGAVSDVYPLRRRLVRDLDLLPDTHVLKHPGYHRRGCCNKEFMNVLSHYKVAVCTSSVYGYTLRKIVEATACGCRVITDLPVDEVLPYIDQNLYRIRPGTPSRHVGELIGKLTRGYDSEFQRVMAERAVEYYDYRLVTEWLAKDIEDLRRSYT